MIYGVTIFLGAFLLFAIQPLIAKMILPWFGGSAAVWATCMLFFQVTLLGGYAYAHGLFRRLSPGRQAVLHTTLLALALLFLPVMPSPAWKPSGNDNPIVRILGLLSVTVGLPCFLLASTSPLLQSWYSRQRGGALPYRFFALSNLASLAALLSYPVAVEPFTTTSQQALVWSGLFVVYVLLCARLGWSSGGAPATLPAAGPERAVPWSRRLQWMILAALPSLLLLAATNHLCQNIASIPFLWVLPLAVYLLSFILCFDSERWYRRPVILPLHAATLGAMAWLLVRQTPEMSLKLVIPVLLAGLFNACMVFHGELSLRKPAASQLTGYYWMIALGGALGGFLVGVAAPYLTRAYLEFPVALAGCALATLFLEYRKTALGDLAWVAVAVGVTAASLAHVNALSAGARSMMRSFYGGLRVVEFDEGSETRRSMIHGTISHGNQFTDASRQKQPTMYYAPGSGVAVAIGYLRRRGRPLRVGVIGLGTGTLAAHGRKGDLFRFYEINPQVVELAWREFTYLRDSAAEVDIVLGDGRLMLERDAALFDLVVVDAFSGDSIPVHLLSLEALELYFRRLAPGGLVALHVSNSVLDLPPLVAALAHQAGAAGALFPVSEDKATGRSGSVWALLARSPAFLEDENVRAGARTLQRRPGLRHWTDEFSNLMQILK